MLFYMYEQRIVHVPDNSTKYEKKITTFFFEISQTPNIYEKIDIITQIWQSQILLYMHQPNMIKIQTDPFLMYTMNNLVKFIETPDMLTKLLWQISETMPYNAF